MIKPPDTRQSTLNAQAHYSAELRRLQQLATDAGYDIGAGLCRECDAKLTEVDVVELGACSQCGAEIETIDNEGE